MLVAVLDGVRWDADEAPRGRDYRCPVCRDQVILKRGVKVAAHFAHHPGSTCTHGVGESRRHQQMKRSLRGWLPDEYTVDLEVEVVADRRADAAVTTPRGNRFVVEFQDSAISVRELVARTRDYNQAGTRVLWVFSDTRITPHHGSEMSVPEELRFVARHSGGGVWLADDDGGLSFGRLDRVHERFSEWYEGGKPRDSDYQPRTLRHVERFRVAPPPANLRPGWVLRPVPSSASRELLLVVLMWFMGRKSASAWDPPT